MDDLYFWYIYLQNWVIYGVNVGKYTSTMDDLGMETERNLTTGDFLGDFLGKKRMMSWVEKS